MTDTARQRAERLSTLPFETVGGGYRNFFSGTGHALRQLWQHRELQGLLVRRELKARYKDSSLGFLWSLIKPLTLLLVYYFAIGKVLGAEHTTPMFAILVFSGLTIWGLFSEILTTGTMSILTNAGLIKKVYVPREIFPLAAVGSALFNFAIQLGVLVIAIIAFGQFVFTWQLLYFFPAVLIVLLFGTAFAILLSALNVYLRDIQYLVDVAMMILVWASPIIYSFANVAANTNKFITSLYLLNPMTVAVIAFQRAMWLPGPTVQNELAKAHVDPATFYPADLNLRLVVLIVIGAVFLWISHRVFLRLQGNFAQEI
ncbi:MAG TPA: ABC transporter permease [Galbitalea sp.]|jgi:ABC-2 type transport system permease protein